MPDTVLEPISTLGKTAADVDSLLQQARDGMLKALEEMAQDSQATTIKNVEAKKKS